MNAQAGGSIRRGCIAADNLIGSKNLRVGTDGPSEIVGSGYGAAQAGHRVAAFADRLAGLMPIIEGLLLVTTRKENAFAACDVVPELATVSLPPEKSRASIRPSSNFSVAWIVLRNRFWCSPR